MGTKNNKQWDWNVGKRLGCESCPLPPRAVGGLEATLGMVWPSPCGQMLSTGLLNESRKEDVWKAYASGSYFKVTWKGAQGRRELEDVSL